MGEIFIYLYYTCYPIYVQCRQEDLILIPLIKTIPSEQFSIFAHDYAVSNNRVIFAVYSSEEYMYNLNGIFVLG